MFLNASSNSHGEKPIYLLPGEKAENDFQIARSTMDHLVHFETFVREGFLNGERAWIFDLEKAYNTK